MGALEHAKGLLADFERVAEERKQMEDPPKLVLIVVRRKRPPTGLHIRTPFGPGEVVNWNEEDGRVAAYVDLARAISTLRQMIRRAG